MILAIRSVAEGVGLALSAFAAIWISRAVGPEAFGNYAVATVIVLLGSVVVNAGLSSAGSQRVAANEVDAGQTWWAVTLLRFAYACIAVLIVELVLLQFHDGSPLLDYLRIAVLALLSMPLKSDWWLFATGRPGASAVVRVATTGTLAALAVTFVRTEDDSHFLPWLVVIPWTVGALVSMLLSFRSPLLSIRGLTRMPAWHSWGSLVSDGSHYLRGDASQFVVTSSDRLFLYAVATPVVVGLYDAAYKLIQPFYAVAAIATDTSYQKLARGFRSGKIAGPLRRYVDIMAFATIPLGAFCAAHADWVVNAVYGADFAEAGGYLRILGWVITFGYLAAILIHPLAAWGRPRDYGNAVMSGTVVALALNFLLIPPFLGYGAAIATLAAKIASMFVGWIYFRRAVAYPVWTDFTVYLTISIVALAASLVTTELAHAGEAAGIVIFALTYMIGVGLLRSNLVRRLLGA